jgi:hypothetical protein
VPKNQPSQLGVSKTDEGYSLTSKGVLGALGGWFGVFEAIVPATVFVILLSITNNVVLAVITAASLSAVSLLIQIIRKKPLTQAIAGAIGIAISAYLPLREGGQPADYFIQGFISNSIYFAVLLVSVLIRWPVVGLLISVLTGKTDMSWRREPAKLRRFQLVTLLWVGLFAARLLVQVPLYLTDQLAALGFFRVAMGVPLYAFLLWTTWLLTRETIRSRQ